MALGVFLAVFFGLFAEVLFGERNFVFRDAGHFYYPYFQLACREWSAGRVPLWNPYENGGEPLAGNPTASVFYPAKLLFGLLPYPVAYKWYLAGHIALSWVTCYLAARGFGIRRGAALAAMAYSLGGFVFFQLYNVVYLVGAAWLPLGLLAVDRVVRLSSLGSAVGLAVVLALQVLGGDPQVAFLTLLVALPYFLIHQMRWKGVLAFLACLGVGYAARQVGPAWRAMKGPALIPAMTSPPGTDGLPAFAMGAPAWFALVAVVGIVAVAVVGAGAARLFKVPEARRSMAQLVLAGALAAILSAVQILPTLDFVRVSDRAAPQAPHEGVAFSLFPLRVVELLLPTFFGKPFPVNERWAPFEPYETGIWVPTLYMGLVPAILGLLSLCLRRGPVPLRFLSILSVVMLWASLGKFGGPSWIFEDQARPFDPVRAEIDANRYGQADGLYRVYEESIPGFRAFRFPSKLLVFSVLGLAILAGFGCDRLVEGEFPRAGPVVLGLAGLGGLGSSIVRGARPVILEWFRSMATVDRQSLYGPLVPEGALRELTRSCDRLALVAGAAAMILYAYRRLGLGPGGLCACLLVLVGIDLGSADRWLVVTDEQSAIDARPAVVAAIEEAEAKEPDRQPFRVYRTRLYHPPHWARTTDENRSVAIARWEHDTIQPKHGLPAGIPYVTSAGTLVVYDVEFFFAPWVVQTPPAMRERLGFPEVMTYFPRRGFDLWNAKYFVLPKAMKPDDEDRGIYTFLWSEAGPPCPVLPGGNSPTEESDYQVLKNPDAFRRAWIVHRCDLRPPLQGLDRMDRQEPMQQILFRRFDGGIPLWPGPPRPVYPLRTTVMIEYDGAENLLEFSRGAPVLSSETVRFETYESDRIRMKVHLESPGFLVLSDTFHPGWRATVAPASSDSPPRPAPILRANRAMRAVPLPAGTHLVEMRLVSWPFLIGATLSVPAWLAVSVWTLWRWRRPRTR